MTATNENRIFTPDNLEGEVLSGCKILHKIAIGGMGTIYKARQLSMNRDVAIKVLSEELSKDRAYVQRFILEARAAGELSHTNLIHVIDVGTHQNLYYYVMEYVDGEGLDAVLEKRGNLSPGEAIDIVLQTAGALDHAHRKGIIHRDIKPDNIILMPNNQIKLADLGIAKRVTTDAEGITQPGMVLGTPFYMAPEQGKDSRLVDRRSDVYALGASFYHMLSGRVPFDGKTCLEVVLKAIEAKPTPLLKIKENLPGRVVAICEKMMQKEPEDRYQTTQEVIQDVERVKAGLDPLLAPMPGSSLRSALPRSLAGQVTSEPHSPRSAAPPPRAAGPAASPAKEQVNLFEVDDLGMGEPEAPSRSRSTTPAQPPAAKSPAAAKPSAHAKRAATPAPRSGGGALFEMDDLEVPDRARTSEAEPDPPAAPARSTRDLDPDAAPARRPARGSGGGPPSRPGRPGAPRPPVEEDEEDLGGQVPAAFAGASHGAINPNAASARDAAVRRYEKLFPMLTLGAAVLIAIFGAISLLKSDPRGPNANDHKIQQPNDPPTGTGGGTTTTPLLSDTPDSRASLQSAEDFASMNPEDLLGIISRFDEVAKSYPTSLSAQTARQRSEETRKRLDELADEAFRRVEQAYKEAQQSQAYGDVLERIATFRIQRGVGTWLERANALEEKIQAEARKLVDDGMEKARSHDAAGDAADALVALDGLLGLGIPDLVQKVTDFGADIAARSRKAVESARAAFQSQYLESQTVQDNAARRRFRVIEEQLSGYLRDPGMRAIRHEIDLELEAVRNARRFMEGVKLAFDSRVGQPETVRLAKSVRQGKIVSFDDEKITLEVSGRNLTAPVAEVTHEEILRLGLIGLGANKPESHVLAAGYWQASGNLEAAAEALNKAISLGGEVQVAQESLEQVQIRKKILATPDALIDLSKSSFHLWDITQGIDADGTAKTLTSQLSRNFVNLRETPWTQYIFTLRARKKSGLNGFLVGFKLNDRYLTWALGDEENTVAWVRGYTETRRPMRLSANRWYELKVIVHGGHATGYVDGARRWRIQLKSGAGNAEAAEMMGVGFVNTVVTYSDLELFDLGQ